MAIAQIHKDQFSTHFLGKYSVNLIAKYYECFLEDSIFLVSEAKGSINGFIMGGASEHLNKSKKVFIKGNLLRYSLETLVNPRVYLDAVLRLKNIILLFKNTTETKKSKNAVSTSNIRMLSIAVNEKAKGTNTAKDLLYSFEESISQSKSYGLSVLKKNIRAINFYKKNGFKLEKEDNLAIYFTKKI